MREGCGDSKEFAFCERFTLASPRYNPMTYAFLCMYSINMIPSLWYHIPLHRSVNNTEMIS